jgi:hypothetical protein
MIEVRDGRTVRFSIDLDAPGPVRMCAVFDDCYDGAPDAGLFSRTVGRGSTFDDAYNDLKQLTEDAKT